MSASLLEEIDRTSGTGTVVRNVCLLLLGLVVGAVAGLFIAGYAGWLPSLNLC